MPTKATAADAQTHQVDEKFNDYRLVTAQWAADYGQMSESWWYARVRGGQAPQPVYKAHRCARWLRADVVTFWERFIREAANDSIACAAVQQQAVKASAAARTKRSAAAATPAANDASAGPVAPHETSHPFAANDSGFQG